MAELIPEAVAYLATIRSPNELGRWRHETDFERTSSLEWRRTREAQNSPGGGVRASRSGLGTPTF